MIELGYDPSIKTAGTSIPPNVGNAAAAAQIAFRRGDGSNQMADLGRTPYSDYTEYQPLNFPEDLKDPNRWQPTRAANGAVQRFSRRTGAVIWRGFPRRHDLMTPHSIWLHRLAPQGSWLSRRESHLLEPRLIVKTSPPSTSGAM